MAIKMILGEIQRKLGRAVYTSQVRIRVNKIQGVQSMEYDQLLGLLRDSPGDIEFDDVIRLIDDTYEFTPVRFTNGDLVNEAGQNANSCKIFSFARRTRLTEQQTLYCFGAFYRDDVLKHPESMDHPNIRNFMKTGWHGVSFDGVALKIRD